jgi:monoamine oxidase
VAVQLHASLCQCFISNFLNLASVVVTFSTSGIYVFVSRIYWAGTETATWLCGYVDGAIQAGERAVLEVLLELRPQSVTAADLQAMKWV